MLIVCPSCASEYTIDTALLGSGRQVRCAKCRTGWFARPEPEPDAATPEAVPPAAAAPAAPPPADPPPLLDAEPARAGRPRSLRAKPGRKPARRSRRAREEPRRWVLGAVSAAVLAIPASFAFRDPIVAAAPRTAKLFAAVGLPVNLAGVTLDGVSATLADENGARVLLAEGIVTGTTGAGASVPPIEITIEDEAGDALYQWSVKPPAARLARGEAVGFKARLASPPPAGRRVLVTFASGRGDAAIASR